MHNVELITFSQYAIAGSGALIAIEANETVSFEIKRVYYIVAVPETKRRGFHAHVRLNQVLICVNGGVTIHVDDGSSTREIRLDRPDQGLFLGSMIWREMYDFSEGAVLLVLADQHFDEADYIRSYEVFLQKLDEKE